MSRMTVEKMIAAIKALHPKNSSFHLSECACGGPSWQQPCHLCGFYPYGRDPKEHARVAGMFDDPHKIPGLLPVGVLLKRYAKRFRNTKLFHQNGEPNSRLMSNDEYHKRWRKRDEAQQVCKEAQRFTERWVMENLKDLPSIEEIFDYIREQKAARIKRYS